MKITSNQNYVNFGQLKMDKEAQESFNEDAVADLKNCNSFMDFFNKMKWAKEAPVDFFVTGDGEHNFSGIAFDKKTNEKLGQTNDYSIHHTINDLIDTVKKNFCCK